MKGVTPILTDLPPASTLVTEDGSLARPDNAPNNNPHVRETVLVRKEPHHMAWASMNEVQLTRIRIHRRTQSLALGEF